MVATGEDTKITISMQDLNKLIQDKVEKAVSEIKTVKVPDYENRQEVTFVNKSYTIEEDGYFQMYLYYQKSSSVNDRIFINGIAVFLNSIPDDWNNIISPIYEVKKGDVITYECTAQTVVGYYLPSR